MRTVTDHKQHFTIWKHRNAFVVYYKGVPQPLAYATIRAARQTVRAWAAALTQQELAT